MCRVYNTYVLKTWCTNSLGKYGSVTFVKVVTVWENTAPPHPHHGDHSLEKYSPITSVMVVTV